MDLQEVKHKEGLNRGRFYIESDGILAGTMEYSREGSVITILHTVVKEQFEGKGMAKLLLNKLVEWVRQNNLKVVTVCEYAKKVMHRDESYRDILNH